MDSRPDAGGRSETATRMFTAFLKECADPEQPDFESLRSGNPELDDDLRRLEQLWRALRSQSGARTGVSLSRRLEDRYGQGIDPEIQLDEEDARNQDFATGVIERLSGRSENAGRYDLRSEIARGGMGVIYRVWDEDLRRTLAMKVLMGSPGLPSEQRPSIDSRNVGRFLEEAQVTSQLDHPGVVPVHELGLDAQRRLYFTMKYVKGRDLRHIIEQAHKERAGWSIARVLGAIVKVCETMAYAHEKGVIHRDLKPANVMVGRFGAVYVMDWGLARIEGRIDKKDLRIRPDLDVTISRVDSERREQLDSDPDSSLVTMDGDVIGTPAYMPPEQARGELANVGKRSDVYAVGAMLYHLLTGEVPYVPTGTKPSARTVLARVLDGPPRRVHEIAPQVPGELVAICERAMAYDADDRYQRMEDLAEDLHAFQEGRVVHAYETGALAELRKWVRRNRAISAAAGVVLVTSIGALVWNSRVEAKGRREVVYTSDLAQLTFLQLEAQRLWPALPTRIEAMEAWLADVQELRDRLPEHERRFHSRKAAGEAGDAERLERFLSGARDLVATAGLALDVENRLAFARTIEERSVTGQDARARWSGAIASIADEAECPLYRGLKIVPQLGLLPLSRNPNTGLWEFLNLLLHEGPLPERESSSGEFRVTPETGVLLALLPGESFSMGAQSKDASAPGYDRDADFDEGPVHKEDVQPFFISKHELTQSQWVRATGINVAFHQPGYVPSVANPPDPPPTLTLPVEYITWVEAWEFCTRMDMSLPTEAQWEFAARGGESGPYWTGTDYKELSGVANLLDDLAHKVLKRPGPGPGLDDHRVMPIEVDAYRANPFGLFSVHGNVAELCREVYRPDYSHASREVDLQKGLHERCTIRGGSWMDPPVYSRLGNRRDFPLRDRENFVGFRPIRELRG